MSRAARYINAMISPSISNASQLVPLSLEACVLHACTLELLAPKPGNVHRGADFADVTFGDFIASAIASAPHLACAAQDVGLAVFNAVQATRQVVRTNTNLGIILLLAPLAAVPREMKLASGLPHVLSQLNAADAAHYWRAIQLAQPGGMGQVAEHDIAGPAPPCIVSAMALAADRDCIAAQYVNRFSQVFENAVPWIRAGCQRGWTLNDAIVHAQLRLLAAVPDTLIARKTNLETAQRVSLGAEQVLQGGEPGDEAYQAALADFDFWLRSDGHRRNPGTTADLITAGLFVLLREGELLPPWR